MFLTLALAGYEFDDNIVQYQIVELFKCMAMKHWLPLSILVVILK